MKQLVVWASTDSFNIDRVISQINRLICYVSKMLENQQTHIREAGTRESFDMFSVLYEWPKTFMKGLSNCRRFISPIDVLKLSIFNRSIQLSERITVWGVSDEDRRVCCREILISNAAERTSGF